MINRLAFDKFPVFIISLFFVGFPFIDVVGQMSYLPFEIIAMLYFHSFVVRKGYLDTFFVWYLLVIFWGVIVTLLSVDVHHSFTSLRYWIIPLFLYVSLSYINLKQIFSVYIWVATIILLIENVILFLYWSKYAYLFTSYPFLSTALIFIGDWPAKIYTSTLVLCMLVGIYFIIEPSKNKNVLLLTNLISAFLSYDRAFWFCLLFIIILYILLESVGVSFKNLIKWCLISLSLLFMLFIFMYYMKMDLHVKERFATYEYWFSVIHVSPFYGVGVGRDALQYYIANYPVPTKILKINPFTVYTSHNFFIDLLVTQGIIGLIIFILMLYKINAAAIKLNVVPKYKYVTLYMTVAVFSKFLVDNQFDNRKMFVFWFFILLGYCLSRNSLDDLSSKS